MDELSDLLAAGHKIHREKFLSLPGLHHAPTGLNCLTGGQLQSPENATLVREFIVEQVPRLCSDEESVTG